MMQQPSTTTAPPQTNSEYRKYLLDRKDALEFELNRVIVEFNCNFYRLDDHVFNATFNSAKKFLHTQLEINRLTLKILDMREAA